VITWGNHTMTPTRQRIVDAALELFSSQGFARTTVGQIEAAAGLTPRAGGFYKHFTSKSAVLEELLRARTERVDRVIAGLDDGPLGDLRAELRILGRVAMRELDAEADLLRIVMKEGDQFPELRREFFERFPRRGYGAALTWLRRALRYREAEVDDPESLAAVIFGGLVHLHLMQVTFNRPPPGTDRERYIETWVQSTLAALPAATAKEALA
jgi:AcrR family transcriptional regulator